MVFLLGAFELNQRGRLSRRNFAECSRKKFDQVGFQIQGLIDREEKGCHYTAKLLSTLKLGRSEKA